MTTAANSITIPTLPRFTDTVVLFLFAAFTISQCRQASYTGVWYLNTLSSSSSSPAAADGLHVSGASIPGIPFVFLGRNQHVSWGATVAAAADMEDLFVLPSSGSDSGSDSDSDSGSDSDSDSESIDISQRIEIIHVRGESEAIAHTAEDTSFGPVISALLSVDAAKSLADSALPWRKAALSSQALLQPMSLTFLHRLNKVRDFEDFTAAASQLPSMALNLVYADTNGNIGRVTTGRYVKQEMSVFRYLLFSPFDYFFTLFFFLCVHTVM
jgi:acyl-homoserine lactone acylase PvdQ